MIILKSNDNAFCNTESIYFKIDDKEVKFDIQQLKKASIITNDRGPFEDDVALAIFINDEIFLIKSEHKSYSNFLFEDLGKMISLNYDMIIAASTSTDNAEFPIFVK